MKALNLFTLFLVILGGVNWGLIGLFGFNLVAALFGVETTATYIVYSLVGISALYQIVPFLRAVDINEPAAEANLRRA